MLGGSGNDILYGGKGADALKGGSGIDTASYAGSTSVSLDLAANLGTFGDAKGDKFVSIENVIGSSFSDILGGSAGVNRLEGGSGDDFLNGHGGADVLIGGPGIDTAMYLNSGSGVIVNLLTNSSMNGDAEGDTLIGIESLFGSFLADTLVGDNGANTLVGFNGTDVISGAGGSDVITGREDADTLAGGAGQDFFTYVLVADTGIGAGLRDTILDLTKADGDQIDLQTIDADILAGGDQDFLFIDTNAFSGLAQEIRYFFDGGNTIIEGELAGDGDDVVDFQIQLLGNITLVAGDFVL